MSGLYDLPGLTQQFQTAVDKGAAAAKEKGQLYTAPATSKDPLINDYMVHLDASGRSYVTGKNGTGEYYFIPPSAKGAKMTPTQDINKAVQAVITAAGGLAKLQSLFTKAGFKGDPYATLADAIRSYSTQSLQAYQDSKGVGTFPLMSSFISKVGGYVSGGSGSGASTSKAGTFTDTTTELTTKGDAYKEANDYVMDILGRQATQEEKDAYYEDIHARELASGVKTVDVRDATGKVTKTTVTGAKVSQDERINSLNAMVKKSLPSYEADKIPATGSKISEDIAKIQKAAAEYGQPMTAGQAMKYIIDGFGTPDYVNKQTERLRLNAMTMFGNLKDHLQNGGTVKDIADQYAYLKSRKLGIPLTDSIADKDVMAAITRDGGLQSTADFTRQMQANPLWRQTEEAHNVAADFADTILKSFRFMG